MFWHLVPARGSRVNASSARASDWEKVIGVKLRIQYPAKNIAHWSAPKPKLSQTEECSAAKFTSEDGVSDASQSCGYRHNRANWGSGDRTPSMGAETQGWKPARFTPSDVLTHPGEKIDLPPCRRLLDGLFAWLCLGSEWMRVVEVKIWSTAISNTSLFLFCF